MNKKKIIRMTTVPQSLDKLLGSQLDFVKKYYEITLVSSNKDKQLFKIGSEKKLNTFPVNLTRKITPVKDLCALIKLIIYFLKVKPDVVHTHTPKAGLIGMLASKISGVKNRLHTVAGMPLLEAKGLKYYILVLVEKLTYKCASKIYFNSSGLLNVTLERKILTTNYNFKVLGKGSTSGVNVDYFNPDLFSPESNKNLRDRLGINDKDIVFLFVGRVVKDKGIDELIQAFKKLSLSHKNIKLLIVGGLEQELNPISKDSLYELYNNENIAYVGYIKDPRQYFAISTIFVFPSYREGFPNVVLQAGSMKLPSIVSNINGNNEIIINDVNGKIVNVKDIEDLYMTMKYLYKNPDLVTNMARKSREIIIGDYEEAYVINLILKEYNSLF